MSEQNLELEAFSKFIVALEPWLGEAVLIGGWAHRLYRLDPRARKLDYPPLTTLDGDVAVPPKLKEQEATVRERLLGAGFTEEFEGEDHPPATHYHYGKGGGFYAEFLAPLLGSEFDRHGERKATMQIGGISAQLLRYIEILLVSPWRVELSEESGFPLSPKRTVQIANPASLLAQKILIHEQRDYKDKAKDLLYMLGNRLADLVPNLEHFDYGQLLKFLFGLILGLEEFLRICFRKDSDPLKIKNWRRGGD